jgi:hypothetical protein
MPCSVFADFLALGHLGPGSSGSCAQYIDALLTLTEFSLLADKAAFQMAFLSS